MNRTRVQQQQCFVHPGTQRITGKQHCSLPQTPPAAAACAAAMLLLLLVCCRFLAI